MVATRGRVLWHEPMLFLILMQVVCSPATPTKHRALSSRVVPRHDLWYSSSYMSHLHSRSNLLKRSGCFNRTHTLEGSWTGDLDGHWVFPHHEAAPAYERSAVCSRLSIGCSTYPNMRTFCRSICRGMAPRPWSGAARVAASSLSIRAQHLRVPPPHWVTLMYLSRHLRMAVSRLHPVCWREGCWRMMKTVRT